MEVRRPLPGSLGREPTYLWGSGYMGISHQLYEQQHSASSRQAERDRGERLDVSPHADAMHANESAAHRG